MRTATTSAVIGVGLIALLVSTEASVKSPDTRQSDSSQAVQSVVPKPGGHPVDEGSIQETPAQRAARLAKNARYNGGVCDLTAAAPDRLCIDQVWPRSLPVIPLDQSDIAVLGLVTSMQPHLSSDHTHIYTEITLSLEEVFKSPRNQRLKANQSVVIDTIGGAITMPSGQTARDNTRIDFLGKTRVGNRYVLFAKKIHHKKDLTLIRGYELRDGQVFRLTEDGNPGDVPVSSIPGDANIPSEEKAFIQALRSAVQGKRVHQASYTYDAPKRR
jgi:hypothetical protein